MLAISLENVSRRVPRSASNIPKAILREMLLPSSARGDDDQYFDAISDVTLSLSPGEKIGILGTHQSGKTTLAKIVAGLLRPSRGVVSVCGATLLISRPTAGFKPMLSFNENLLFLAELFGLSRTLSEQLLDETMFRCGLSKNASQLPIGDFSPYLVRFAAFHMTLQFPSDILIIDETIRAGSGEYGDESRYLLSEKIKNNTTLLVSNDQEFLSEHVKACCLLDAGLLSAPMSVEEGFDRLEQALFDKDNQPLSVDLSDKHEPPDSNSLSNDKRGITDAGFTESFVAKSEFEVMYEHVLGVPPNSRRAKSIRFGASPLVAATTLFDGRQYSRGSLSHQRQVGDIVNLETTIYVRRAIEIDGLEVLLFGAAGLVSSEETTQPSGLLQEGAWYRLSLAFEIPDRCKGLCGVALRPITKRKRTSRASPIQIKLVVFSVLHGTTEFLEEKISQFDFSADRWEVPAQSAPLS